MSPYLTNPLRTQDTVLHTRRRAVEMAREYGYDWDRLTELQRLKMIGRAESEISTTQTTLATGADKE